MLYGKRSLLAEEVFLISFYGTPEERKIMSLMLDFKAVKRRILSCLCGKIRKRVDR
ncbi:MAG: hypothetical protein PHQ23_10390 [Candidatus Wallbacteria bacterium]|nr:hypothetical protein [Candidatus Wallbacteria bacterium]